MYIVHVAIDIPLRLRNGVLAFFQKRLVPGVMVEMKTSSDLANLARIRAFIRENVPCGMMSERESAEVELAVQEAASNIMIHAYQGASEKPIWITLEASMEQLHIRLYHTGIAHHPEHIKTPVFDGSQEGGFGLYIIFQCLDQVVFYQDLNGRNGVSLIKQLNGGVSNECTA